MKASWVTSIVVKCAASFAWETQDIGSEVCVEGMALCTVVCAAAARIAHLVLYAGSLRCILCLGPEAFFETALDSEDWTGIMRSCRPTVQIVMHQGGRWMPYFSYTRSFDTVCCI